MQATESRLAALKAKQFDLAIIGGGIIGAGIARDAAGRGLRVALFEKNDYGSGTSSRSTRLIHGGLRYLELLDFALVRLDLKERETLLHIAPHLVRPLGFIVPFYRKSLFYRTRLRLGLYLYDWLSFDKSLPNHKSFSKAETLRQEPSLKAEGLQGSSLYYDGQVALTERLVMENILAARQKGALCYNYTKVEELVKQGNRVVGVRVRDELGEGENELVEVQARQVINASGAWLDGVEQQLTGQASRKVRRTKGIHFTSPASVKNAVVLFADDNRLFFVIPWLNYAWVGTTDTDFESELESVRADRDDVEYLLKTVRGVFPRADWDTIYFTNAGVRALVRQDGKDESAVSRKHALIDHTDKGDLPGLLSVVGGKITAYRGIAEDAVDLATKKLGLRAKSTTAKEVLPGGATGSLDEFRPLLQSQAAQFGITAAQAEHLLNLYGSRAAEVLALISIDKTLAAPLHPAYPVLEAELRFSVEQEQCLTLCDFMMRRTELYFSPDQGRQVASLVSEKLAQLLGWDDPRRHQEELAYAQALAWTQEWREQPATPAPAIQTDPELVKA